VNTVSFNIILRQMTKMSQRKQQPNCHSKKNSSEQWFQTFPLKGDKSWLTTLLGSCTKQYLTEVNWHVLFYCRTKSVAENVRYFVKRLL